MANSELIEPAALTWRDNQPFAPRYDDIYYSGDGVEEFRQVFLNPSELLSRDDLSDCVQVAELGFGTGWNFVQCAESIMQNTHRRLHYVAFEAHPLTPVDWQRLAQQRPQPLFQDLAVAAPPLLSGWHRRSFAEGRIQLSVFHGDVLAGLQDLQARQRQPIDAWFLDGFDPRKNPKMWQPDVFNALAQCSNKGSRISTFTAAGQVRRGLAAAGFTMRRVDQRPRKRESLAGVYTLETKRSKTPQPSEMRVFGAGIAGCTIARELANQGIDVALFDPRGIGTGGSKMQTSALHCRLLGDSSGAGEFRARAYHHARQALAHYPSVRAIDAVQLALSADEVRKQQRLYDVYAHPTSPWLQFLEASKLDQRLGIKALSGLLFPNSALINLNLLCQQLADHPRVTLIPTLGQGRPDVIACASASRDLVTSMPLEIGDVYGQLDWIAPPDIPSADRLDTAIVGNGYVLPGAEHWVLGSTYEQTPWPPATATEHNITSNQRFLGDGPIEPVRYQRAARCVSSDRDPVIGKVDEHTWVSAAHGSMGSSSAPFAASLIVSDVLGWIPPASPRALASAAPDRFIERQARRGAKKIGV